MKRVEKQLAAIEADFAKNLDLLNEEEFKRANEARREEQAQLQARLEELASSLTAQSLRHDAVAALPAQIRSFLKDFQSLDVSGRSARGADYSAALIAACTRSAVRGSALMRTPTASAIALAMAADTGPLAASPMDLIW